MSSHEHPFDTSHLRTAFVPDEVESTPIKVAIAAQREAIEAIDSQISDLEQRIDDLRTNRKDISEKMTFNEAFLAPIRRVAPEILCDIFEYCLPPEPTPNPTVPLLLMCVCHTWRRIVQETPQLWAQIYVDASTPLSFVEMFLRNSKRVPLDVTLALVDHINENDSEAGGAWGDPWPDAQAAPQATIVMDAIEIVPVLGEQHRRIRRLSLHAPYSILKTFFPSRFTTKTSFLEDLTIYCPDTPRVSSLESRFGLKGGRLRTLDINGKILSTISINRTFGLRRISLQGTVPVSKLIQFLRVSPALEELTMENFKPSMFNEPSDINDLYFEPVFLTKLSLFHMDWSMRYYGDSRQSPLRYIRTPAVTSVFFNRYPRPWDDLYNLLTWSADTISCLSLEGLNCNPYQFFRMIGGLSALEVLSLADLHVKEIWETLTPEEDAIPNRWVCPHLQTLELRKVDVETTFLQFVRRRTRPIQSGTIQNGFHYLRSVVISQQYVFPDVSTSLGNLENEREDFSFQLCDFRDQREDYRGWGVPYYAQ